MMFAIFSQLFKHFEERDAFKKALILAIPFSVNIGGIGTIIGTPPNAIAYSTRTVDTREMARTGTIVSSLGIFVILALALVLISIMT